MASLFSFGSQPVEVEIKLTGEGDRRQVEVKGEKDKKEMCPVYYDGESVIGQVGSSLRLTTMSFSVGVASYTLYGRNVFDQVTVRVKDGRKFQHDGIRIELIGSIGELITSFILILAEKLCKNYFTTEAIITSLFLYHRN